ncbi:MAG: hypothetical protein ACNJA3_28470 (plasmid) [Pseudomonas rhizophila]|uniref:hypothetical protein n=1 Tax=Pseudomonas rhizophila TaxID=2045200 RepID=UPI003F6BABBA
MDANTTRIGKTGLVITRVAALDVTPNTSDVAIVIPAAELKASLWEPEVDPSPESQADWGGWTWAFQLGNGTQALLTNDRRGGIRWSLWVDEEVDPYDALDALLDVIAGAGFSANVSQF